MGDIEYSCADMMHQKAGKSMQQLHPEIPDTPFLYAVLFKDQQIADKSVLASQGPEGPR